MADLSSLDPSLPDLVSVTEDLSVSAGQTQEETGAETVVQENNIDIEKVLQSLGTMGGTQGKKKFHRSRIEPRQTEEIFVKMPQRKRQQVLEWVREQSTRRPDLLRIALSSKVEGAEGKPQHWQFKAFDSGRFVDFQWIGMQLHFVPGFETQEQLFRMSGHVLDVLAVPFSLLLQPWESLSPRSPSSPGATVIVVDAPFLCLHHLVEAFVRQDSIMFSSSSSSSSSSVSSLLVDPEEEKKAGEQKKRLEQKMKVQQNMAKRYWREYGGLGTEEAQTVFRLVAGVLLEMRRQSDLESPAVTLFSMSDQRALVVFFREGGFVQFEIDEQMVSDQEGIRQVNKVSRQQQFFHGLAEIMVPNDQQKQQIFSMLAESNSRTKGMTSRPEIKEAMLMSWPIKEHQESVAKPSVLCQFKDCSKKSSKDLAQIVKGSRAIGWTDEEQNELLSTFQPPLYLDSEAKAIGQKVKVLMSKRWAEHFQALVDSETDRRILEEGATEDADRQQEISHEVLQKYEEEALQEESLLRSEMVALLRAPLKTCSRCKTVAYCSPTCQRADWARHQLFCRPVSPSSPSQ